MVIIKEPGDLKDKKGDIILTIGNFDGVHLGHQKILKAVAECAHSLNMTSVAITFDPHPVRVLAPERGLRLITPFAEKVRLMGIYGIDIVLCIKFSRDFSNIKPDDFIRDVIIGKLGACEVIVGHNYAFGKGKKGTTELLRRRGKKHGFNVRVIRNARLFSDVVSSSRIRSLLLRGRVCEASWLLGRPYMIEGKVVKGAGRGNSLLNIPTANISTAYELVPKEGVYAVKIGLGDAIFDGVANIGRNPTFGENLMSYEAHIFDFSGDILNKDIRVYFIDRIRDERTFPDISALHDGIMKDIEFAREIMSAKKYPAVV